MTVPWTSLSVGFANTESTPDTPEIIATIHGEGYRFCGDPEAIPACR